LLSRFTSHIPPGQFARYLLVGVWNTAFGYGTYAALTAILNPHFRYGYVLASLLSSLLSITVAFLGYKWFVFKTRGHYLREWARCVAVYASGILLGLAILPSLVYGLQRSGLSRGAPYVAGALLTGVTAIYNFLGHKRFSFRPADAAAERG
jgi:putative flippase GtrA